MDTQTNSPARLNVTPVSTGARAGHQACCGMLDNRMRFLICIMGVLAISLSQMARGVLQLRITDMVNDETGNSSHIIGIDDCPWPEDESTYQSSVTTIGPINPDEKQKDVTGKRFAWTTKQQTSLLGIFYYSYGAFMIPGGRLAEIYGAKYVLGASVAISGLISLATPLLAKRFYLLLIARLLMGAAQAGVFPGAYALIGKWMTSSEASIFAPLCKMSTRFGMALASCLPYIVSGWPGDFYATGIICALWTLLWAFIATSIPEDNICVTELELMRINRKKQKNIQQSTAIKLKVMNSNGHSSSNDSKVTDQQVQASQSPRRKATPWVALLTSSSVIGFVMVKLAINYSSDFVGVLFNMYLHNVYHSSSETNGTVNLIFYVVYVTLMIPVGWFANYLIKRTTLCFGLILMRSCDLLYTSFIFVIFGLLSTFNGGAETMLPYDLSEEYPATIMAIGNSVATISAPSLTALTGWVLGDEKHSVRRWNIILLLIAAYNAIAGAYFALYVKAEPLQFDENDSKPPGNNNIEAKPKQSNKEQPDSTELKCVEVSSSTNSNPLSATKLSANMPVEQVSGSAPGVKVDIEKIDEPKDKAASKVIKEQRSSQAAKSSDTCCDPKTEPKARSDPDIGNSEQGVGGQFSYWLGKLVGAPLTRRSTKLAGQT